MAIASSRRGLGFFGATWEIFKKDARIELRTREVLITAGVFAVVVAVLASIAYSIHPKYNRATAAGTIWIAIFFASVLSFSRVWQRERDESALTALLVAPIARPAIFLGKAIATFGMLLLVEVPLVALTMFFFAIDFSPPDGTVMDPRAAGEPWTTHALVFGAFLLVGTATLALIGTLFGVMTVRARARDLVIAIITFPILSPALVCGVAGTRSAFETQPVDDYIGYLGFLGLAAFFGLAGGVGLFGFLLDD